MVIPEVPLPPAEDLITWGLCKISDVHEMNARSMQEKRYIVELERRVEFLESQLAKEKYRGDTLERVLAGRQSVPWMPAYNSMKVPVKVISLAKEGEDGDDSVFARQSEGFIPLSTSTPAAAATAATAAATAQNPESPQPVRYYDMQPMSGQKN